ncbi:hypothetical protein COC69_33230 [Bacillus cereus]|uniref:Group-specific protein n=1 Tax=Bacillus cereus TaxID=1396 RepID=A0A9X7CGE1_BACCE|nr:hypothetical protein [Bacillus cereus]PGS60697.1 hypothetical protein COC69_33230 [Bacillus cereus]
MYILKRKKLKNIVLASIIGFSGFSIAGTSVSAAENTNDVNMHQPIKAEDMSIKQLQDALQHKQDPFIDNVKILIDIHFNELELLWKSTSTPLKEDLVNLLLGSEKEYYQKVDAGLRKHFNEISVLFKSTSPVLQLDLIKILEYLPK